MSEINKIFGQLLKEVRVQKGVSQDDLAALCGLSRASIANYESGQQGISLEHAVAIAKRLELSIDSMLKMSSPDRAAIESKLLDVEDRLREKILEAVDSKKRET